MSEAGRTGAAFGVNAGPVQINALQAAWLREIGLPRALLPQRAAATAASPSVPEVSDAAAVAQATEPVRARKVGVDGPEKLTLKAPQEASGPSAADAPAPAHGQVVDATALPGRPVSADDRHDASITSQGAQAPGPSSRSVRPGASARPQPAEQQAFVPIARDPAEIAGADVHGLHEQVSGCSACGLSASRQHAVFGAGPTPARWMVIGEAPGEQEDVESLPFVGKSGELLNEMLRAVGIDRERDVFAANVIKCRPPGNRNPRPDEIEACKPFLLRQIQLVQPERLLVVGRFAAQVLLGSSANLNSLRGQVHQFDDGAGRTVPLVVSYHPAYLLRSPQEKARAWRDLALAAQSAKEAQPG